jgi:hypothetical protein
MFRFLCILTLLVTVALAANTKGFNDGRALESQIWSERYEKAVMELTTVRMKYHGPLHFYFHHRGALYYVKNAKDLENKRKWIKAR